MASEVVGEQTVAINGEDSIVLARSAARELAKRCGFGAVDQSRITTAVSELARNVVRYANAGCGSAVIREIGSATGAVGIEVIVHDEGPGIANVDQALREGFTTGRGLGLGLSGTRRLMDDFTIESELGRGTTVTVRKWRR
jgi:serine/threonine-protein kinase RsbT